MGHTNRLIEVSESNFKGLRMVFKPTVSYRFDKQFETLDSAVEFCKVALAPAQTVEGVIEHEVNLCSEYWNEKKRIVDQLLCKLPGKGEDLLTTHEKDSYGDIKDKCIVKLQVMLTSAPEIKASDKYCDHKNNFAKIATTDLFKYFTDENVSTLYFEYVWTANVQVRLVGTIARDEVKVAGQPYQPAKEEEVFTDWFPLYELSTSDKPGNNYAQTELSIYVDDMYIGNGCYEHNKVKSVKRAEWTVKSERIHAVVTCD